MGLDPGDKADSGFEERLTLLGYIDSALFVKSRLAKNHRTISALN